MATSVPPFDKPVRRRPTVALARQLDVARTQARAARARNKAAREQFASDRRVARRSFEELGDRLDRARARRTLPRAVAGQLPIDPDTWLLHVRYQRTRRPADRALLVEAYRGYAISLARRLQRDGEPFDDLVQVALEALLLAIERFDAHRRLPFPALATPTILGSLKRHYRDLGWSVRVPRRIHELAGPVRDAADRLTVEYGRSPTIEEIADEVGVSGEEVREAQQAAHARSVSSLDAPLGEDGSRGDRLGAADIDLDRAETRVALGQALAELSAREQELVQLYFVEERTQTEIAARFGVSQMQVSRWVAATVRRLRDRFPAGMT